MKNQHTLLYVLMFWVVAISGVIAYFTISTKNNEENARIVYINNCQNKIDFYEELSANIIACYRSIDYIKKEVDDFIFIDSHYLNTDLREARGQIFRENLYEFTTKCDILIDYPQMPRDELLGGKASFVKDTSIESRAVCRALLLRANENNLEEYKQNCLTEIDSMSIWLIGLSQYINSEKEFFRNQIQTYKK